MAGFIAKAQTTDIDVNRVKEVGSDKGELEVARWVGIEQVKQKLEEQEDPNFSKEKAIPYEFEFNLPNIHTLANRLLKRWIELCGEEE